MGEQPKGDRGADVALEEFKALRAEIMARQQVQSAALTAALTATAAIGTIAFANEERLPILLILPFVLGGLGVFHTPLERDSKPVVGLPGFFHRAKQLVKRHVAKDFYRPTAQDLEVVSVHDANGGLLALGQVRDRIRREGLQR